MTNAPGIYIVTLNNDDPISVNAQDRRRPRAITVTRANCKFGKATNLVRRKANYEKTFGAKNVNFHPIAEMDDIASIEQMVLGRLRDYRICGASGRKNEWLGGITPAEVERIVISTLAESGFTYQIVGSLPTTINREVK
jgi:hypothetical protein